MPVFTYTIINKAGKKASGVMYSNSLEDAKKELEGKSTKIKKIREDIQKKGFWNKSFGTVKFKEKIIFLKYLSTIIKSGLGIKRGLEILTAQVKNKYFAKVLNKIREEVEHGQTFNQSLSKYPKIFSPIFTNMIAIGEVSGTLPASLDYLDDLLTKDYELVRKVKGAATYPVIILVFVVGVSLGLIKFIIPRIIRVFDNFDFDLPFTTQLLLDANYIMTKYWYLIIAGLATAVIGFMSLYKVRAAKKFFHSFYLKIPIVGSLIKQIQITRFTRITSSMLQSGITLVEGINITANTLTNLVYSDYLHEAQAYLTSGGDVAGYLEQRPDLFDDIVVQMIHLGETTGNLDQTLEILADLNAIEVDEKIKSLSSLIGPALLVFMAVLVGGIAISIITPIYNLPTLIQQGG